MPSRPAETLTRRAALAGLGLGAGLLAGCGGGNAKWHGIDVTGTSPALKLSMTRARDGKPVTEADYRGQVALLYFGYTFCPDICPTTLANIASVIDATGKDAAKISVLFVTVDPARDTLPVMADYVKNFSPRMQGLRGTDNQIAALARRYRIAYSVTPAHDGKPYEVSHSSAVYAFDATGAARLLFSSLATAKPDIAGTAADLKRLVAAPVDQGFLGRLMAMV